MEAFLSSLADILEVEAVKPDDVLGNFEEWDSLSVLSVIAMVDSDYHVTLNSQEVRNAVDAASLYGLIMGKKA